MRSSTATEKTAPSSSRRPWDCAVSRARPTRPRGRSPTGMRTSRSRRCTDVNLGILHDPAEVGTDPVRATRLKNHQYRTTPLRALPLHAPYFHDGGAATLADVVAHYDRVFTLGLSARQQADLVEYLKTLPGDPEEDH